MGNDFDRGGSSMEPGEVVVSDNGRRFVIGTQLAVSKEGCTNPYCSRIDGRCVGWHCPHCNAPTSSQGHNCAEGKAKGPREQGSS
jgi:hypothetical protein